MKKKISTGVAAATIAIIAVAFSGGAASAQGYSWVGAEPTDQVNPHFTDAEPMNQTNGYSWAG